MVRAHRGQLIEGDKKTHRARIVEMPSSALRELGDHLDAYVPQEPVRLCHPERGSLGDVELAAHVRRRCHLPAALRPPLPGGLRSSAGRIYHARAVAMASSSTAAERDAPGVVPRRRAAAISGQRRQLALYLRCVEEVLTVAEHQLVHRFLVLAWHSQHLAPVVPAMRDPQVPHLS